MIGLGDERAHFKVYIANQPIFQDFHDLSRVRALLPGEINAIGQACGNGWRKVFNVYAKLVFALPTLTQETLGLRLEHLNWQAYRDQHLLQRTSKTALLYSRPSFSVSHNIQVIMGRTYAKTLHLPADLKWLDHEFAVHFDSRTVICPYFDYRQLSNAKIIRLTEIITHFTN